MVAASGAWRGGVARGLSRRHTPRSWPATMPAFSDSSKGCRGPGRGPWPLLVPTCPPEHLHQPAPAHTCTRANRGGTHLAPAKDRGERVTNPQFPPLVPSEVKVAWSCTTLCDPMDYTVHGILQAIILEWGAFPFSRGSSQPMDRTQVSHIAGRFFTS